jgi:hypothetical protein
MEKSTMDMLLACRRAYLLAEVIALALSNFGEVTGSVVSRHK